MNKQTVCFVAGKSGGHIIPALTLAWQAKQKNPAISCVFFSTDTTLDRQLLNTAPNVDHHIALTLPNFPYKKLHLYPFWILYFFVAWARSLYYLYTYKPSAIISTGGYISIPVCVAGKLLGIPIKLYELNAIPGQAARLLAPLAHTIVVCFAQTMRYFPPKKCVYESYPVRFTLADKIYNKQEIVLQLGFSWNKKTILIVGGSQGSLFINEFIKEYIENTTHVHATLQIIHQTGAQDTTNWQSFYHSYGIPAHVFTYHNAIENYYKAADLIICRSGAGTLWEIIFFDKQTITIPLETATTNHQRDNAYAMALTHPTLCTVITQHDIAVDKSKVFACITDKLFVSIPETIAAPTVQK